MRGWWQLWRAGENASKINLFLGSEADILQNQEPGPVKEGWLLQGVDLMPRGPGTGTGTSGLCLQIHSCREIGIAGLSRRAD